MIGKFNKPDEKSRGKMKKNKITYRIHSYQVSMCGGGTRHTTLEPHFSDFARNVVTPSDASTSFPKENRKKLKEI